MCAVEINLGQEVHPAREEHAAAARGWLATNSATLPCRQKGSLCPAQRYAKPRDIGPTQSSALACRRGSRVRKLALIPPHAFQLAEFIKYDEIAHRYLLEYIPTGACHACRIEVT